MSENFTYPYSLSTDRCSPYLFDTKYAAKLLYDNSQRLFVPSTDLHIKVIEVGVKDLIFTEPGPLAAYLEQSQSTGTRIFLIPQEYSWGRLKISEDALKLLFHHLQAFPAVLDVLCAFGEQTSTISDSLGSFHSYSKGSKTEYCYLTKTVEEHGREKDQEPWSIRQMGVYHQRDTGTGRNEFIIFNPTKAFQQRLKDAQSQTKTSPNAEDIQELFQSHSAWRWRWYLSFWEQKLGHLTSKAHLSQAERPRNGEADTNLRIEYGDVQDVQVIYDRMNTAKFVLECNLRICETFRTSNTQLLQTELTQQLMRADNLLDKTKSVSGLMQDILSFGGLDSLRISNELAEMDNKNMVKLTTKSQKDAQILKKITILTMVYLPATFVSQFLSMGYIRVNSATRPPALDFANELWIFAVMTVTLVAVTVGLWLLLPWPMRWWNRWRARNASLSQAADEKV